MKPNKPSKIVLQIPGALFLDVDGRWWTSASGEIAPTRRVDTTGRYFRFYAALAGLEVKA